jgi:hypothetical protein
MPAVSRFFSTFILDFRDDKNVATTGDAAGKTARATQMNDALVRTLDRMVRKIDVENARSAVRCR